MCFFAVASMEYAILGISLIQFKSMRNALQGSSSIFASHKVTNARKLSMKAASKSEISKDDADLSLTIFQFLFVRYLRPANQIFVHTSSSTSRAHFSSENGISPVASLARSRECMDN